MKIKVIILVLIVVLSSCARRSCGGLSGRRCVDIEYKNQNNFIKNKSIV